MKIWQKQGLSTAEAVESFTIGNDRIFDLRLARYDIQGTLAHVTMLCEAGLLHDEDLVQIRLGMKDILTGIEDGSFKIDDHCEDVHSQIEWQLIQSIGEAGKKIHSGRSRNDQVATDINLYLKDEIKAIEEKLLSVFNMLIERSNAHAGDLMPGYTHLQHAMPSSFGLWFGAYAEALTDDMDMLQTAYRMADRNPMGSGAGYGSSFPLNRSRTTALLGFSSMHYNSIYAQMGRGKTEKTVAMSLACIAGTLSKLSMDACLYNSQNFGFIRFPDELTTGSSIMPHKKNPDVFELIRGRCNRIQSVPNELILLINNLPSGYHRDIQLTKEIIFPAIESLKACLDMTLLMLQNMEIRQGILDDERYQHIFTVEKLNEMVNMGIPFREAYRQLSTEIQDGKFVYNNRQLNHTHEGSIGNLCNEQIADRMYRIKKERPTN